MTSEETLIELMRRIGLDREEVDERHRLLDWQRDDALRLSRVRSNGRATPFWRRFMMRRPWRRN